MTVRLEQLLAAATPGPWVATMAHVVGRHGLDVASTHASDGSYERADADAALIAKTPDMARLLIDMGEALSKRSLIDYEDGQWRTAAIPESKVLPLLARLDALGKDTA